jgi:hypothetical protein
MHIFAFVFALWFCLLASKSISVHASLTMEVLPGQTRCVGQNMDKEDMALFSFGAQHLTGTSEKQIALHKDRQTLFVSIQDPDGAYLLNKEKVVVNARPREFKKSTLTQNGVYDLCFELVGGEVPLHAYFYVDFKSRNSPGSLDAVSTQLDTKDVPEVEKKLQRAEHSLSKIQKEIEFAKSQEMLLKQSGDAMSGRIQWFSLLSMAVLAITSVWQLLYLRSYFTSKKVM